MALTTKIKTIITLSFHFLYLLQIIKYSVAVSPFARLISQHSRCDCQGERKINAKEPGSPYLSTYHIARTSGNHHLFGGKLPEKEDHISL